MLFWSLVLFQSLKNKNKNQFSCRESALWLVLTFSCIFTGSRFIYLLFMCCEMLKSAFWVAFAGFNRRVFLEYHIIYNELVIKQGKLKNNITKDAISINFSMNFFSVIRTDGLQVKMQSYHILLSSSSGGPDDDIFPYVSFSGIPADVQGAGGGIRNLQVPHKTQRLWAETRHRKSDLKLGPERHTAAV